MTGTNPNFDNRAGQGMPSAGELDPHTVTLPQGETVNPPTRIVVHSPGDGQNTHCAGLVKNGQIQVLVGSTPSQLKALRDFIITTGCCCWGSVLGGVEVVASTGATSGAMWLCQVLRNAVG